jgi:LmbE family N-acetylglucosaminyl deacetylase
LLAALATPPARGQGRAASAGGNESGEAELYQSLLDLQNPWTVMCVAAHPDDEDGATLTVLRRKYGAHTVTVFSTYGEGGQNATGPELYEELGAIRARETEEASRIQGSEAHFLGLQDFGFSKSSAEAFRFWGREEALRRMVLKIRQLRPDVIITNHNTTSGHGHHQATGILILEAFDAAADPRRFPEQLRGEVRVWQAQRLFVRLGSPGGAANKAAEDEAARAGKLISVNRNERDEVRGSTYAEQALSALQRHATQGPWPRTVPASWAASAIRYSLVRSAKEAPPLPPNAQTFLDGLRPPPELADKLARLTAKAPAPPYTASAHETILSALVAARKSGTLIAPKSAGDETRLQLMAERLNHALATASGIKAALAPRNDVLIPGTTTAVSLRISNGGKRAAHVRGISLRGLSSTGKLKFPRTIAPGESVDIELQTNTPRSAAISVPRAEHLYDGNFSGEELGAGVSVEVDGAAFPVKVVTRLNVAPAVEIARLTPSPFVVTPGIVERPSATKPAGITNPVLNTEFKLLLVNHQSRTFRGKVITAGPSTQTAKRVSEITLAPNETVS